VTQLPRRSRLLVVASTFPAGPADGTPAFVRDLAVAEATDFDTVVLVPRSSGGSRRESAGRMVVQRFRYFIRPWEDLADGAIIENLRSRPSRLLQVVPFLVAEAWALRTAVRRHRPDVLHLYWIVPQGVAALISARRVPWLVTTLGGDVYALRDPVSRWLQRRVLRRAAAVTTMNADMRDRVIALGADPDRTHVLPMGADVDTVRQVGAGVPSEPGRLLFAGRLVEKKGAAVLLDAVRLLADRPGWSLVVVGDGPLRGVLQAQAGDLAVTFRGTLSRAELAAEYARAEILVVPSVTAASGDQDGLPVVLLEGMAAGCAIVASRLPGLDIAVRDGNAGVLVPPGDAAALAAELRRLLDDPDRRERLGAAARARADQFSVAAAGVRYRALLHTLAGLARPAAE